MAQARSQQLHTPTHQGRYTIRPSYYQVAGALATKVNGRLNATNDRIATKRYPLVACQTTVGKIATNGHPTTIT